MFASGDSSNVYSYKVFGCSYNMRANEWGDVHFVLWAWPFRTMAKRAMNIGYGEEKGVFHMCVVWLSIFTATCKFDFSLKDWFLKNISK